MQDLASEFSKNFRRRPLPGRGAQAPGVGTQTLVPLNFSAVVASLFSAVERWYITNLGMGCYIAFCVLVLWVWRLFILCFFSSATVSAVLQPCRTCHMLYLFLLHVVLCSWQINDDDVVVVVITVVALSASETIWCRVTWAQLSLRWTRNVA